MPYIKQAARPIGPLEHGHLMAGPIELLRGGQPGRTGADDGHALAGARKRRLGHEPALGDRPIGDRHFDLLDGHGIFVDPQHASRFARGGADAAGELREIVRRVQSLQRLVPLIAKHQIVPVRDDVSQRAAGVAERHAAVHAPRALQLQLVRVEHLEKLVKVLQPLGDRLLAVRPPRVIHEATQIAHL